jgi:hypothetical protein
MFEKCSVCGKRTPQGNTGKISFSYKGLKFQVFQLGSQCDECVKRETIKDFKEYGKELVEMKSGKLVVNWTLYSKLSRTAREGTYSKERVKRMTRILYNLGILSFKDEGNWLITDGNLIQLNPSRIAGVFYFTRREDAVEYARLNYSNTHYGWHIQQQQIGEIISRENVLKTKPA